MDSQWAVFRRWCFAIAKCSHKTVSLLSLPPLIVLQVKLRSPLILSHVVLSIFANHKTFFAKHALSQKILSKSFLRVQNRLTLTTSRTTPPTPSHASFSKKPQSARL